MQHLVPLQPLSLFSSYSSLFCSLDQSVTLSHFLRLHCIVFLIFSFFFSFFLLLAVPSSHSSEQFQMQKGERAHAILQKPPRRSSRNWCCDDTLWCYPPTWNKYWVMMRISSSIQLIETILTFIIYFYFSEFCKKLLLQDWLFQNHESQFWSLFDEN